VFLEQVDAPAVDGHWRSIGKLDAMPREQLENRVLRRRLTLIGLEPDIDQPADIAKFVARAAELEDELAAFHAEHVCGAGKLRGRHHRIAEYLVKSFRCPDLPLECGAAHRGKLVVLPQDGAERSLDIIRTGAVQ
jgi:hypothetical protein